MLPPATTRKTGLLSDGFMMASVVASAYYMPKVPYVPIPIGPQVYLPLLWGALTLFSDTEGILAVLKQRLLLFFGGLIAYMVLNHFLVAGFAYEGISQSGRLISTFAFVVCMAHYVSRNRRNMLLALGVCGLVVGGSCLWYLGEVFRGEPFRGLRLTLYSEIYANKENLEQIEEFSASGLVPFPHAMGYHISFLLVVATLGFVLVRPGSGTLRSIGVRHGCLAFALLGVIALEFSSQRSAILAAALSVFAALFYGRRLKKIVPLLLLGVVLGGAALALKKVDTQDNRGLQDRRAVDKLLSTEVWQQSWYRAELQIEAVRVVFAYPMGLLMANKTWPMVAFANGGGGGETDSQGNVLAPHNGYLTVAMKYGALFFLVVVALVVDCVRTSWMLLRVYRVHGARLGAEGFVSASLALGLLTVQTMTHNGGLLNFEPACLLALGFLAGTWIHVHGAKQRRPMPRPRVGSRSNFPMHLL